MEKDEHEDDDCSWRCDEDECNTLNPPENIRCGECGKKKTPDESNEAENEIKTSSLTKNLTFRFPKRMIPY